MGYAVKDVAHALGISRQSIWNWKHVTVPNKRKERQRKLDAKQEEDACAWICAHPTSTLQDVCQHIKLLCGLSVSISYVHRMLQRHCITWKKGCKHFGEQDVRKVKEFLDTLPGEATESWLALDEASFTLNLTKEYGYGPKGGRVRLTRPGPRGQRYSLLLCISPQGYVNHTLVQGGINAKCFQGFLTRLPSRCTIALDNASTHKATGTLQKQGIPTVPQTAMQNEQTLMYLPPYSPQLNPTELAFNVLRAHVRACNVRTGAQLADALTTKLASLSTRGFFHHCWNNTKWGLPHK